MTCGCLQHKCGDARLALMNQRDIARRIVVRLRNVRIDPSDPMKSALEMERIAFTSLSIPGQQLTPPSQWPSRNPQQRK